MLIAMSSLPDPSVRRDLYRVRREHLRRGCADRDLARRGHATLPRPVGRVAVSRRTARASGGHAPLFRSCVDGPLLEVRVPFLDHKLVEWAARVPTRHKVRRLETKVVLKEAARGILPDSIVDKKKLGFFRFASHAWLVSQLRGELGERSSRRTGRPRTCSTPAWCSA